MVQVRQLLLIGKAPLTNLVLQIATKVHAGAFAEIQAGHAGPWEATDAMNNEIEGFLK